MNTEVFCSLTVYYDGQFWCGFFEIREKGSIRVCKFIFGAEPQNFEILELISRKWNNLNFGSSIDVEDKIKVRKNPKVRQRKINQEINKVGIGTKSQQAIKLQIEQRKIENKSRNKEKKEFDQKEKFEMKQNKKKEKRKGH